MLRHLGRLSAAEFGHQRPVLKPSDQICTGYPVDMLEDPTSLQCGLKIDPLPQHMTTSVYSNNNNVRCMFSIFIINMACF